MTYHIEKIDDSPFSALVFSNTYERLFDHICDIEVTLSSQDVKGQVLFDSYGCNGNENRFFVAQFDGTNVDLSSLTRLSSRKLDEFLLGVCNRYYVENPIPTSVSIFVD